MALVEMPSVALVNPIVRFPTVARVRSSPMAGDPHVLAPNPIPVTADPYIARRRGYAVNLHPGRRRGDRDRGAGDIVSAGRINYTGAQGRRQGRHDRCIS